ncbi:MAG: hypothetical protein CL908_20255 [Deltaproteobacteria bacterium]|nr:hypothetical protein [Deltaproteobacteria bacterium]
MAKTGDGENLGTAEGAVMGRAAHTLHADPPVLNDTWAIRLLGAETRAIVEDVDYDEKSIDRAGYDTAKILSVGIGALRYAEDEVERGLARGIDQYVILGAGFDTFALRREDLVGRLQVYEVDFPDVQALKRSRIEASDAIPAMLPRFVPVDFESTGLREGLGRSKFDETRPAVFSWMNTLPYVSEAGTESTLREIAGFAARGSRIVLNYQADIALTDEQIEFLKTVVQNVEQGGEPWISRWKPKAFETLLARAGLRLVEHATEADLFTRYFQDRSDGFAPAIPCRLITAEIAA